jgi:hypothetical protein
MSEAPSLQARDELWLDHEPGACFSGFRCRFRVKLKETRHYSPWVEAKMMGKSPGRMWNCVCEMMGR